MKSNPITSPSPSPDTTYVASARKGLTKRWTAVLAAVGLAVGMLLIQSCSKAKAGPNGGDMVALGDGKTNAEIMANSDTGEAMVHTWNQDLKSPLPIEAKPLTMGTDANSVRLDPHPVPGDPPGYCSQFYGRADWLRGGGAHHGWLSSGGRTNGHMWSEMGGHGGGMGPGGHGGMRQ
jgi:hypothetical protein